MKLLTFLLVLLTSSASSFAQLVFDYDEAGNCIKRHILVLKKSNTDDTNETAPLIEQTTLGRIIIYPNPTKDLVTLQFPDSDIEQTRTILLFDQAGRTLLSHRESSNNATLDLSQHSPGMYFLIIQSGATKLDFKIIKE